jgi:hypothetical protein
MQNRADYIIRMIEAVGRILAILVGRILGRSAQPGEVEQKLREAGSIVGVNLDIARAATPEMLEMMVSPSGEIDTSKCFVAAEMLYTDGLDAALDERYDQARNSWHRAVRLYHLIEPRGSFLVGWPEASERITDIERRLSEFP